MPLFHWLTLHWGDVVPAWLAVIVAAVFGWLSWRSSRQSKTARDAAKTAEAEAKTQAERAERATKAAEDAAAAAKGTATALGRFAAAHETQTALLQGAADAAERFPWVIEHHGGMDYRLRNRTNTPKYDVAATGEPAGRPPGAFRPGGGRGNHLNVVDGRETVELDLFIAAQTEDRRVTVSWRPTSDHTGDPWTQRVGLP